MRIKRESCKEPIKIRLDQNATINLNYVTETASALLGELSQSIIVRRALSMLADYYMNTVMTKALLKDGSIDKLAEFIKIEREEMLLAAGRQGEGKGKTWLKRRGK
jgi:hypothetical protein